MLRLFARLRGTLWLRRVLAGYLALTLMVAAAGIVMLVLGQNGALVVLIGLTAGLPVNLWGAWEVGRDRARRARQLRKRTPIDRSGG